jgi:hypothetical protein
LKLTICLENSLSLSPGFLMSLPAFGWRKEGHEILAYIAYQNLAPATRIKVTHLLSETPGPVGPELMAKAASWPDAIKRHPGTPVTIFRDFNVRSAADTHEFHFADMAGDAYNPATDSDKGRSVVNGIENCVTGLL